MTKVQIKTAGEYLKEILDEQNIKAIEVSEGTGISKDMMSKILSGKRTISLENSIRLGRYFGQSDTFWHNQQTNRELRLLNRKLKEEFLKITPRTTA